MLYQLSYAHHIAFVAFACAKAAFMAHPAGLEPATIRLEGGCSIQLSYGRLFLLSRLERKSWLRLQQALGEVCCLLAQRLAVLDKRGVCYSGRHASSTGFFKKIPVR